MKVKSTLLKRIKVCLIYLIHDDFKVGLIEQCPKCKSIEITKTRSYEKQFENGSEYNAGYKCDKCGAEASIIEEWYYHAK